MAYKRKTKDVWRIEIDYGYGEYEVVSEYDSYREAKEDFHEYYIHANSYNGRCILRKRREKIA